LTLPPAPSVFQYVSRRNAARASRLARHGHCFSKTPQGGTSTMKRSFNTLFRRCQVCHRIFRSSGTQRPSSCRTCRDEQELALFWDWLDSKL
jgi:hypothetical protein